MRRTRSHRPLIIETQEDIDRLEALDLGEPVPDHNATSAIVLICVVSLLMILASLFLIADIKL